MRKKIGRIFLVPAERRKKQQEILVADSSRRQSRYEITPKDGLYKSR